MLFKLFSFNFVFIIIICLACNCNGTLGAITYMAPKVGYVNGGSTYRVIADNFLDNPVLKIRRTNDGVEVAFSFLLKTGNLYEYTSPQKPDYNPPSINPKKRKLDDGSGQSYKLLVKIPGNNFYTDYGDWVFVTPSFDKIEPANYYPNQNNAVLTVYGRNFIINEYETPTVYFGNGALTLTSATPTLLKCYIPNYNNLGNFLVSVRFPNDEVINLPFYFEYKNPQITSILPNLVISGTVGQIKLSGNIYDIYDNPTSVVRINNLLCLNLNAGKKEGVSCSVPEIDVGIGTEVQFPIALNVRGIDATSSVFYTVANPRFDGFSPSKGLLDGMTDITITGLLLNYVTQVYVGDCECSIITKESAKIVCRTSKGKSDGYTQPVSLYLYNKVIFSEKKYQYYSSFIDTIRPSTISDKGTWKVTITGGGFVPNSKLVIGSTVYKQDATSTISIIYIDLNAADLVKLGNSFEVNVNVKQTPPTVLKVLTPSIKSISPERGYQYTTTPITITTENFPVGLSADELANFVSFKINNKICTDLKQTSETTLTCNVPVGDTAKDEVLSLFLKDNEYKSTVKFTYYIPKITAQTQSTTVPIGGGELKITGTDLNWVSKIKFDTTFITGCIIATDLITCTIPLHIPGSYPVILIVETGGDHEFNTGTNIDYIGPSLTNISPNQGTKKALQLITLTGTSFGNNVDDIKVYAGLSECTGIAFVNTKITCTLPTLDIGTYAVVIQVRPNSISPYIVSVNDISYRSNQLSCLGLPIEGGNNPVDWWFIYKLGKKKNNQNLADYLYIDSTMDSLELKHGLIYSVNDFSPLEATFEQHKSYYYMTYNDQIGKRTDMGTQEKGKPFHLNGHGHVKNILVWDDPDNFDYIPGYHIIHSNPYFPSIKSDTEYAVKSDGKKFLGLPDNSQHFFCYNFNDFNFVTKFLLRNDAIFQPVTKYFDNLDTDTVLQNKYPYLYDYIASYTDDFPDRVPTNGVPKKSPKDLSEDCITELKINDKTIDQLENICWWKTDVMQIAGLKMRFFMKTSAAIPDKEMKNVGGLTPYFMVRTKKPKYDGLDIWKIIAKTFNRKFFSNTWLTSSNYDPQEEVTSITELEFPKEFSTFDIPNNKYVNSEYKSTTDHSKMGFPMYPAYGNSATNDNENYFCVGDLNRHFGQGRRGGGYLCFQHPTLVYQFNRMVRKYSVIKDNGKIATSQNEDGSELFFKFKQPIKLARPNTWRNNIYIEVKDYLSDNLIISQLPKSIYSITEVTIGMSVDVAIFTQSLRNIWDSDNVHEYGEQSTVPVVPVYPGVDIQTYTAKDIFSLHYIAFDDTVGSVCDYSATITDCTKDLARTLQITRTNPLVIPPYPSAYNLLYLHPLPLRDYTILDHQDFKLLKFTQKFQQKLQGATVDQYKYLIDSLNTFTKPQFKAPFIIRQTTDICEEEIAYFMTLQYIYYKVSDTSKITFTTEVNNLNWANGVIFAISKKLLNELNGNNNKEIDDCFETYVGFDDIVTYQDANTVTGATSAEKFKRSAAAAWDWMSSSYSDGGDDIIIRADSNDVIPISDLIDVIVSYQDEGNDDDLGIPLKDLLDLLNPTYSTETNNDILVNRKIKEAEANNDDGSGDIVMAMAIPSFMKTGIFRSNFMTMETSSSSEQSSSEQSVEIVYEVSSSAQTLLECDESETLSGIEQLLSSLNSINESDLIDLSSYQLEKLELSIDKWISIYGQSRAIQTLILDPLNQYHNQPIRFVYEINRDQTGNPISLSYQTAGTTGSQVSILSPLSISSITFILESIIVYQLESRLKFGDFEVFYLPKSDNYNGYISDEYDGMIIATVNSLLCDIQMISELNYLTYNFDSVCINSGPIITSVSVSSGETSGNYTITIGGIRFNSSMTVSIGDQDCLETILISSTEISCLVPSGSGSQNEIQISTNETIYNLQRTKYWFSYDKPSITSIEPDIINTHGNDYLTINGANFGDDASTATILIDSRLSCSPIVSISSESIICLTPPALGQYRSVTVTINDQLAKWDINSIGTQSLSFSGPIIEFIDPSSGDPTDSIVIFGDGIGLMEEGDLPPLVLIDNNLIEITNISSTDVIELELEYGTLNEQIQVQIGDQITSPSNITYLPPVVSYFNDSLVQTKGGLIQITGYGYGIYRDEIDFKLDSGIEIECNPFDLFIECYIPAGIGKNYSILASVSDQLVDFDGISNLISYYPPEIYNTVINSNTLYIQGANFIPIEDGVTFDPATSFINLIYSDANQTCTTFKTSSTIECPITSLPLSIQVVIEQQYSNILTF